MGKKPGRPPKSKSYAGIGEPRQRKYTKTFGMSVTEAMYRDVKKVADSEYRTVCDQVRFFISEGLKGGTDEITSMQSR